ncbi:MAG: DNA-processing protein DprA [Thermoanaerobaculia bacterium]|nr:DNA-processing protein DprA [Thermoanaerobaculia bacterium]
MSQKNRARDLYIAYGILEFLTPARKRLLKEHFGSPSDVSATDTNSIATLLRLPENRAKLVKDPLQLREISDTVERWRDDAIVLGDEDYPKLLAEICDPPFALFPSGNRGYLHRSAVGVVGSRRASRYGLSVAERLAADLSSLGITVVSGLARGIDQAAHRGALGHDGSTIAVLGTGLDVDYPRGSGKLRKQIAEEGLILTELPPGSPPRPEHFPIRNRIISGLSLGIVIVEATDRSGSLITARMAAEQDREVFAVPGSIFGRGSIGPHRLIQYGAKLVHDVDDILDELRLEVRRQEKKQAARDGLSARILERLSIENPIHVDTLAIQLDTNPATLSASLLELEIEGTIRSVPGGGWIRHPCS